MRDDWRRAIRGLAFAYARRSLEATARDPKFRGTIPNLVAYASQFCQPRAEAFGGAVEETARWTFLNIHAH